MSGDRLSESGTVLGIDVGFSKRSKSTCLCLLQWRAGALSVRFAKTGSVREERVRVLRQLVGVQPLAAIAIDGPLAKDLRIVRHYRSAEALLTRGLFQKRGKPGQTSSPTGQQLHLHATELADIALEHADVADASHADPISPKRVVEAFPNAFLAVLTPEELIPSIQRDASDRYWEVLVGGSRVLAEVLDRLIGAIRSSVDLRTITDHDERAAFVCALTAVCIAGSTYVAVGDPMDGDIILPPLDAWGRSPGGRGWAEFALRENLATLAKGLPANPSQVIPRIYWSAP